MFSSTDTGGVVVGGFVLLHEETIKMTNSVISVFFIKTSILIIKVSHSYLYTTVKLCEAVLVGVATDETVTVTLHQCCCGKPINVIGVLLALLVVAPFWLIAPLVV